MTTTQLIRAALAEADRKALERAKYREEFDADLSPADLARGTMGETWIRDECAKANGLGRFADLRDGGNLPTASSFPWLFYALLGFASAGMVAAMAFGGW